MPTLPALAGVEFRMFRGPSDYPHLVRIINVWARGEGDDRVETVDGIASGYDHLDRCDPARDLLVAEIDGTPVGYSRVWWDQEPDGPRVYKFVCFLDPEHRSRGIGGALLDWNEARLREIAAEHDDAPEKVLQAFCNDRNVAATALVRAAGYEAVTYSAEMVRPSVDDLPDHPLPEGLELRPVRDEISARSGRPRPRRFATTGDTSSRPKRTTRVPAPPVHRPDALEGRVGRGGRRRPGALVHRPAENAEFGRQRGYTEDISTARRWRRRGVAKALIVESIRELAGRGMTEVALGVHTENPNGAFELYSSLGYEVVGTWTVYRKPL